MCATEYDVPDGNLPRTYRPSSWPPMAKPHVRPARCTCHERSGTQRSEHGGIHMEDGMETFSFE